MKFGEAGFRRLHPVLTLEPYFPGKHRVAVCFEDSIYISKLNQNDAIHKQITVRQVAWRFFVLKKTN